MENTTGMTLDSEKLRAAMRAWSTGVTIVTSLHEGRKHGMTVNSFTSISLEPAMITVSLRSFTRTHELVSKSRVFGLTILSVGQSKVSDIFSGQATEDQDRFAGLPTETLVTGSPLIVGGLAWLDCRVTDNFKAGVNTLFIAEVVAAHDINDGQPLIYHNRKYWSLSQL